MFYVKKSLGEDAGIRIDITDDNVFCRCSKCGCEVQVDIVEVIKETVDLYGTEIFCDVCAMDEFGEK